MGKGLPRQLTAAIRPDAVWVNRAAAFAAWQADAGVAGAEMPEQARRILFNMCGKRFAAMALLDEKSLSAEDEPQDDGYSESADEGDAKPANAGADAADEVEPSNASRRVFGELFGGDAAQKVARAQVKDEFAVALRDLIQRTGVLSREAILAFRKSRDLPELDISRADKYPQEVSSSGRPTAVAKRYRKLLVCLGLWPESDDESGTPRARQCANSASVSRRWTGPTKLHK